MKNFSTIICTTGVVLFLSILFGQVTHAQEGYVVNKDSNPAQIIEDLQLPPPSLVGSTYFKDDWLNGNITLTKNRQIKNYPIRYDMYNNQLEIRFEGDVRVCPYQLIQEFTIENSSLLGSSRFIKSENLKHADGTPIVGFYRVIAEGKYALLAHHEVVLKDTEYVEEFNMGSRDKKYIKKMQYYYAIDNIVSAKFKKSVIKSDKNFSSRSDDIKMFMKENDLSFSNEFDLKELFKFLNESL